MNYPKLVWKKDYKNYGIHAYKYFPSGMIEIHAFDYECDSLEDVYTNKFLDYSKQEILYIVKDELNSLGVK